MDPALNPNLNRGNDAKGSLSSAQLKPDGEVGRGLMEVIVGALIVLIVGSVFLHVIRLGWNMYRLNSATSVVAEMLNKARDSAMKDDKKISVIFDADQNKFGIDRNGNGKLDRNEAEDMPDGITISDASAICFLPTGALPAKSKPPRIVVSNNRDSRSVNVSSAGSIDIE